MKNNHVEKLIQALPEDAKEVIIFILQQDFILTLVGGGTRDFLLTGILPEDLDFELRHAESFQGEEWQKKIDQLIENIKSEFQAGVEKLPYGIFRLFYQKLALEFSSPREELYDGGVSHHNFTAKLSSNPPYETSFKRRDFAINAIGLELARRGDSLTGTLVDPFGGVADIENRVLGCISADFTRDPVRFLRLLRFKSAFQFDLNPETSKMISKFELSELTTHYLKYELAKSDLKNFFKDYKNLTMVIEDLPQFHVLLLKMADVHWPKLVVEHLEEVAILYALLTKESESSETYVEIANLLGGGTSLARYLVKLDHFKFKCVHWDFERELKELKKVDFEKAEKMPFFQFLCEMKGIVPLKDSLQRILDHDKVSLNIGEKLKFFDRLQLHHLRGGEKFLNTVERERIDGPRRNSLKIFIHLNE